jgi:hypothetical protein
VTLAVFLLGGRDRYVDTEDVAMKTNELSPGRFSWRKYPQQINLELVRVRLSEAKTEAHGTFLRGSTPRGWMLTARGLKWATEIATDERNLQPQLDGGRERGGSVDAQRVDRERTRIVSTSAWAKWPGRAPEILATEAQEVLRLDSYATDELRDVKADRLRKVFLADAAMLEFIEYIARLVETRRT